jgi:mono/diheme cytochrome c family protein
MGVLMSVRFRAGLLVACMSLTVVVAACTAAADSVPTRAPIPAANVVATATVKAGGTPGGAPAPVNGSPGAQLFAAQGCVACHVIKGQGGTVGPELSTIGTVAATRKPGMDAAAYIHESIVSPNAFVTQGYQPGLMPQTFGQALSSEQIDQLVNYLLELK